MVPHRETRDFCIQSIEPNIINLLRGLQLLCVLYKRSDSAVQWWRPRECGKLKPTMVSAIFCSGFFGLFAYKEGNM